MLESTNDKKVLTQLAEDFSTYPRPSEDIHITNHRRLPHSSVLDSKASTNALDVIIAQYAKIQLTIEVLGKRQAILRKAIERCESLPDVTANGIEVEQEADDGRSKKKTKKAPISKGDDRPCGWDRRLIWDDEQVRDWMGDVDGDGEVDEDSVCRLARRRCDRHQG